jgi:dTDP-glucose 4,6-dehydratase
VTAKVPQSGSFSSALPETNPIVLEDLKGMLAQRIDWDFFRHKTITVTGAGGFIGLNIVKSLLAAHLIFDIEMRVIGVVRSTDKALLVLRDWQSLEAFDFFEQDLSHELAPEFPPSDIIVHAASPATPRAFTTDPLGVIAPNVYGTQNLLDHLRSRTDPRFLYVSSGEVYGDVSDLDAEIREDYVGNLAFLDERSVYAQAKRTGETLCSAWSRQHGLHTSVVRLFHTYGPGIPLGDGRVFSDFVRDGLAGGPIRVFGDGSARRSFCYISDAVSGIIQVLIRGDDRTAYNVGNPYAELSVLELAEIVAASSALDLTDVVQDCRPATDRYSPSRLARARPDIGRIESLGWSPVVLPTEGFRRTILSCLHEGVAKNSPQIDS